MIRHPEFLLIPVYIENITINDLTLVLAWANLSIVTLQILTFIGLMADSDNKRAGGVRFCCLLMAIAWSIFCTAFGGMLALTGVVVAGLALTVSIFLFKKHFQFKKRN